MPGICTHHLQCRRRGFSPLVLVRWQTGSIPNLPGWLHRDFFGSGWLRCVLNTCTAGGAESAPANGSLECCGRGSSLRLGFLAGWSLLVLCCTAGGQLDLCSCGLPSASHIAGRDGRRGRPSKTLLWPTLALHSGEFAAEVGDQFGMVVPTCILLAHATAEGTRLAAMFAGAVTSQNYWWLGSAVNTLLLNLSARLGWSRFWAFKIMNALRGPTRLLFPTAWNVLHDHLKLFGGYCRFIPLWSLIFARAWAYRVSFEGAKAPAFNIPAAVAAVVLFLLEILEDLLIVHEVLPVAPIPEAVIQRHRSFGNNDPRQLFTMEMRPNVSNLSKSPEAVSLGKSDAFKPVVPSSELLDHMVAESAVGPRRSHSKLRAWLGQERYLTPSLLLHGLRPMPFFAPLLWFWSWRSWPTRCLTRSWDQDSCWA